MGISIGKTCAKCGMDEWEIFDNPVDYSEMCCYCAEKLHQVTQNVFVKRDFVDNFECPECGGLSGTLEENRKKLGVRCSNCGKLTIYINKPYGVEPIPARNDDVLKCPKCGSTQITTGARGVSWTRGLIGASKTVNRCGKCGYTWKPKG